MTSSLMKIGAARSVQEQLQTLCGNSNDLQAWLSPRFAERMKPVAPTSTCHDHYVTREERLALDRVITIENLYWRILTARDGTFTDVRVSVYVFDADDQRHLGTFEVWGRQRGKPKTVDFDGAVDNAFANLMTVKDFAAALELQ